MPIYKGNEFVERVYKGDERLRRVYKGNELTYGLYDINYHNLGNDYEPTNGEITEYAGGLTREIAPNEDNYDFDDYFYDYRTHWYGGFDDQNFEEERPKDEDQYIIEPDDQEDLDLYAKGKQKKFSYEGSYTITSTTTTTSTTIIPDSGESTSSQRDRFVEEIKKHIGEKSTTVSPYNGQVGGPNGMDWCARYISICLYTIGFTDHLITTFAPDFFNYINLGRVPGKTFISRKINELYNNKYPSDGVIDEADLQPGDIISSFWYYYNSNYWSSYYDTHPNGWINEANKTAHGRHVVTCVGHDENGRALVVGGNESRTVKGPHLINSFGTHLNNYGIVARLDGSLDPTPPSPTPDPEETTTTSDFSNTVTFGDDCEDQNDPYIPDEYITGDGIKPENEETEGEVPPLPEDGTFWSDLPENGYTRSGGWYLYSAGIPGECVWGANGRTGQMRGGYNAPGRYDSTTSGGYANVWLQPGQHGGNGKSTTDGTKVGIGDCILYGCTQACTSDFGEPISADAASNHVVVVEEVLGDGSFKISTGNSGGDHRFHGIKTESATPGKYSTAFGQYVSGYLINDTNRPSGSVTTYSFSSTVEYITSERVFDYDLNDGSEGEEIDRSDTDWYYDGDEEE